MNKMTNYEHLRATIRSSFSNFSPHELFQIYVGGPTLARGYINRPEQQAKRFIPRPEGVPESYGSRLYRTGDWGYMLSDGSLEICGRCDTMVKIRGYSIEVQVSVAILLAILL